MKAGRIPMAILVAALLPGGALAGVGTDIPFFEDVTAEVGLADTPAFRLSIADINGDGYPDFVLHHATNPSTGDVRDKQFVYLNVPGSDPGDPFSRQFIDFTVDSGIRANRQGSPDGRHSDSAIFADVDNDGDLDMFNTVYVHDQFGLATDRNELMLNDGDGHFSLAPNSPFHLEALRNSAAAVFLDYDNDSNINLFVGNWYNNFPTWDLLSPDLLYQGHGDGSFTNVSAAAGIDAAQTSIYGVAAWDWDGDGFQDLFAPSYSHTRTAAAHRHWQNNGDGTFTQVQSSSGYGQYTGFGTGRASFGSMPRDYDNDGDVDRMEILTHGTGDGTRGVHTTTITNEGGVYSWDFFRVDGRESEDPDTSHHGDHYVSWLDFNNDGRVDFVLTESGYDNNRFYLFMQGSSHTFGPVTRVSGMDEINTLDLPPHNALAFDYDLDGDEDLLVGFSGSTGLRVYRNREGTNNNWLVITLEGGGAPGFSNRSAIGGRVQVEANGMTQTRTVYAGPGHQGPQMPLSLHFGLGNADSVESVSVDWPNQAQTSRDFTTLPPNLFLTIREICDLAPAPVLLGVKQGSDVELTWDEPAVAWWWNMHRGEGPDPAQWGEPHEVWLPETRYLDVAAVPAGPDLYYRASVVNDCGETPR